MPKVSLKDVALSLRATLVAAETLLSEGAEGGKRAQALTAAAFDMIYGPKGVRTAKVNDPSVHFPGDVQVLDQSGRPIVAAEVRAKPVPENEIDGFARHLAEAGIARGVVVAVARTQPKLPYTEIEERISQDRGVLMTVLDSVDTLVKTTFAWSPKPLPDVLAEFPERMNERLRDIEVESATIQRWRELVQPAEKAISQIPTTS